MEHQDPQPEPAPGGGEETLRRLQERLDAASRAAERLVADAAATAGEALRGSAGAAAAASSQGDSAPGAVPPAGWQVPPHEDDGGRRSELELLTQFVASLRDLIPPELQQRLAEALRELLLALRALIDWYLERTERRRATSSEVQDIPIQ